MLRVSLVKLQLNLELRSIFRSLKQNVSASEKRLTHIIYHAFGPDEYKEIGDFVLFPLVVRSPRFLQRGRSKQEICLRKWMRPRAVATSPWGRRRATTLTAKATPETWPSRKKVG